MEKRKDKSLLIVEDEMEIVDLLKYELKDLVDVFHIANDGYQALDLLQTHQIDAVLSDIKMPRMTGLQLLRAMRDLGKEQPFIILSGHGDKANLVEGLRLGAWDFLEKPYQRDELCKVVEEAVAVGVKIRNVDEEMKNLLTKADTLSRVEFERYQRIHRSLLLMRVKNIPSGKAS